MQEKLNTLWDNLRVVNNETLLISQNKKSINLDPQEYRLDDFGALIKRSEYGKRTDFGWTIDHIFPISLGGTDNIRNLQLLHWRNNELKGNDFPTYNWDTCFNRESDLIENISLPRPRFTFTPSFIESISDLYPQILQYRVNEIDSIII